MRLRNLLLMSLGSAGLSAAVAALAQDTGLVPEGASPQDTRPSQGATNDGPISDTGAPAPPNTPDGAPANAVDQEVAEEAEEAGEAGVGGTTVSRCQIGQTPQRDDRLVLECKEYSFSGLTVRNWKTATYTTSSFGQNVTFKIPKFTAFTAPGTAATTTDLVLHETTDWAHSQTMNTFVGKNSTNKGGTQLVIARNGLVTQHTDLAGRLAHAPPFNRHSIGIEVVNPIKSTNCPNSRNVTVYFDDGKAHPDYCLPTKQQMVALETVADWMADSSTTGLRVGRRFGGVLTRGTTHDLAMGSLRSPSANSGIWAHGQIDSNRQDGFFSVAYLWLRWNCTSLNADQAYSRAVTVIGQRLDYNRHSVGSVPLTCQ